MTYREKLLANSRPNKDGEMVNLVDMIGENKIVVAISVSKNDDYDVVVSRDCIDSGHILHLKRIYDLDANITNEDNVFILSLTSWQRMLENNLWNKH